MGWKPRSDVDPGQAVEGGWLNWNDGETKELIVINDQPVKHVIHWVQGKGQPCTGPGCGACNLGIRASQRFTVMTLYDGEQSRWEMALLTWRDLAVIAEMQGTLRGLRLRVHRSGTGRNTRYTLIADGIADESELPPDVPPEAWKPDAETTQKSGLLSGDFTQLHAVAADPQGAAAYAKELAASLDTTAKAVLAELAISRGELWQPSSPTQQLHELILELERRTAELQSAQADEPTPSLDDLLS